MTTKEIHIRVQEGLRKLNSSVYQNLRPEQIDFLLNLNQIRIVKDKIKPQAEDNSQPFENQKAYDDIQNLIERDFSLPTFVKIVNLGKSYSYGILPSDYLALSSDTSYIYENCNQTQAVIQQVSDYTEKIITFDVSNVAAVQKPFQIDPGYTTSPYFQNLNISIDSTPVFTANNVTRGFGNIYVGYGAQTDAFYPIKWIMEFMNRKLPLTCTSGNILTGIYYESYNDYFIPNNFIFVFQAVNNTTPTVTLTYDNKTFNSLLYKTDVYKVATQQSNLEEVSNRLTKLSRYSDVLNNNSFYGTKPKSPISIIKNDKIQVFFDKRFIVSQIYIDYVRIPRQIDINLNQSCELKEQLQYELVDWCIEYAKLTINNPTWKDTLADNMLRSE